MYISCLCKGRKKKHYIILVPIYLANLHTSTTADVLSCTLASNITTFVLGFYYISNSLI